MRQSFLLSLAVHLLFISAALITSPFQPKSKIDYSEVIKVTFASLPSTPVSEPVDITTLTTPVPLKDEPDEFPISDPTTQPEAVIDEPEVEEPEPEPEDRDNKINLDAMRDSEDQEGTADGEIDADMMGAGGSIFSGASVDDASFHYPFWYRQSFTKLAQNFRNTVPYDGTLVCVIYFQVIKSGRVIELKVLESSGIDAFDDVCLRAIKKSDPFPPLPMDFRDEIIGITLPIQWTPR